LGVTVSRFPIKEGGHWCGMPGNVGEGWDNGAEDSVIAMLGTLSVVRDKAR
jgi:hypothetical protein